MALWRIRATVDDRPGYLSVLTASLALRSVNILTVQVHTTEAGAVDDFLVDAPDALSEGDLLAAVTRGRGRDAFIARAEAHGLADQPARALALAGRLVHDPDALGEALVALLGATEVRWRPADARPGLDGRRMCLADPAGGTLEVLRREPGFTPAEYARAQALAEVAGAVLRPGGAPALLLPDGRELRIRPASGEDAAAVRELLHRRGSSAGRAPGAARIARLLEPSGGVTLLALDGPVVVAGGRLVAEGDLGEVALLVGAAWRRRGIGTALLRRLIGYAEGAGLAALVAHAAAGDVALLRTLRRCGAVRLDRDGATVSVTLPVPAGRPAPDHAPAAPR